ncbi:MAG: pilus assembly protein TadG-related protein [bacterium]
MTKMNKRIKINTPGINGERGSAIVWISIMMIVMIGMASLVVDVGFIQRERTRMQGACDAAALAGAKQLPFDAASLLSARDLAAKNGFTHGEDDVTVEGARNPDGAHPGYYQVQISHPIHFFLAPIMGYNQGVISVDATASYTSPLPMYISGSSGQYGVNGIQNLSCFGPYGYFSYGDAYSTKWLNNGNDNPYYNEDGYDFMVEVKSDYFAKNGTNQIVFQVFDPDCWNVGDAQDAGTGKVDEIRPAPSYPHPQPSTKYTTTKFELYAPDSTPGDYSDDTLIASATWTPSMKTSDMKWVTPGGWELNLATYGYGKYRINVETTNGSSENGFNLRAGNPTACGGGTWFPDNGTEITAVGTLPINFNVSATVTVDLGYIPPEAGGYNVFVNKFDTDVGAKSVVYSDQYGNTWPGVLAGDGTFKIDKLAIPQGYGGGRLYAKYTAGAQDTSSWQLYFDGQSSEGPSDLKLVD